MNNQISKLSEYNLSSNYASSPVSAALISYFYRSGAINQVSIPILCVLTFQYICKNKSIFLDELKLIPGKHGVGTYSTRTQSKISPHLIKYLNSRFRLKLAMRR